MKSLERKILINLIRPMNTSTSADVNENRKLSIMSHITLKYSSFHLVIILVIKQNGNWFVTTTYEFSYSYHHKFGVTLQEHGACQLDCSMVLKFILKNRKMLFQNIASLTSVFLKVILSETNGMIGFAVLISSVSCDSKYLGILS